MIKNETASLNDKNLIKFTKGDTFRCCVTVKDIFGEEYPIIEGDKVFLTVRSSKYMPPMITLNLNNGIEILQDKVFIQFEPEHTENMDSNYYYIYDVEIILKENQDKFTIIKEAPFYLISEQTTKIEEVE